jgi:DMSO reductase anchor subunit
VTERPLVAFTLLAQMAVGAFLTLGALDVWAGGLAGDPAAHALTNGVLLAIGPVMALSLLASLFHLGAPLAAWRAVRNVRSSWLSREVLLASSFTVAGAVFAVLRWSGAGSPSLRTRIAFLAGACGLAMVYAMARVYRLRTVPAWDSVLTTISFFATTVLLGSLAVGTGLAVLPGVPETLVTPPLHVIAVAAAGAFGAELAQRGKGTLHGVRRGLLLAGLAMCVLLLLTGGRATWLLVGAFASALAAQGLGRLLFYDTGLRRAL